MKPRTSAAEPFERIGTFGLVVSCSALFVCGSSLMLTKPRYVFRYYTASFYKIACSSKFWIEHTNIGRECCQKSTKIWHSIVFECCLAHGFSGQRAVGMCRS
jgi:hypothetical protein